LFKQTRYTFSVLKEKSDDTQREQWEAVNRRKTEKTISKGKKTRRRTRICKYYSENESKM